MPVHVSSTCAHHQEVKIALHSLWYHHTYRWQSRARDGHLISLLNTTGMTNLMSRTIMFSSHSLYHSLTLQLTVRFSRNLCWWYVTLQRD